MKKQRINLPISSIKANTGQLPWLPKNPRQWTQTDVERTRDSILEDPDFLEDRPLLVIPLNESSWVVFAGNLRREGAKAGKVKDAPCIVYHPETDEDYATIKRRAIKDNGSFGKWDYDALANEWDDLDLTDWGVPAWDIEPDFNPTQTNTGQSSSIQGVEGILPPELSGVDLTPDDLPKIEGSDETAMDRVIIVYPKDRVKDVAQLLGLENIEKVVYNAKEIPLLQ